MLTNLKHTTVELQREIETYLDTFGILCRVFGRSKEESSLNKKIEREPGKYAIGSRLIQDVIGLRIVLYFQEDIESVKSLLCKKYSYDNSSSTIDVPTTKEFSVTRFNLIFKLPTQYLSAFEREVLNLPVDTTFEIQLRSMLSEGWHEVEHDLRYKCPSNWDEQTDLSRALNGVMATLETSEWSMKKIFDDLAYRHYKSRNWEAMLQNKLRIRLDPKLSPKLSGLLDNNLELAKEIYRIEKNILIGLLQENVWSIPLNGDNLIFLWNFHMIKNQDLVDLTPPLLKEYFGVSSK